MKDALKALVPGVAVLLVAVAFWWTHADLTRIAHLYGFVIYGVGLALAFVFHRSRAFVAISTLGLVDVAILGRTNDPAQIMGFGTATLVLFGVLGVVRDRGVFSRIGLVQFLFAGTLASATSLIFANSERVQDLLGQLEILPLEVVWPGYPQVTLAIAGLAFLLVGYGLRRYRGPVERSFVWSVILLLVAMHPIVDKAVSELLLMASGLIITLALVEASYVMAYRDELTGLPGRRALSQYLDGIGGSYTIAMVDIDHFKQFNDRHGHDVGDQVLQLVASCLARAPGGAKAYRYGGEEFTLLLPGRTREEALPHLEKVRASVEAARFSLRSWQRPRVKPSGGKVKKVKGEKARRKPRALSVTVSIGMADTAGAESDPGAILKKADKALYRAKNKGRNQVSK